MDDNELRERIAFLRGYIKYPSGRWGRKDMPREANTLTEPPPIDGNAVMELLIKWIRETSHGQAQISGDGIILQGYLNCTIVRQPESADLNYYIGGLAEALVLALGGKDD